MLSVVANNKTPLYFKGLNCLFILFTLYGVILIITDGSIVQTNQDFKPPTINYLRNLYYSILPVYACFYYTKKGYLTSKLFQNWVVAFVLIAIVEFFRIKREELEILLEAGSDRVDITNNIGYNILLLTPCALVFYKKPFLQYIILGICVIFVVLSMKRGAMLIMVPCLAMLIWEKLKTAKRGHVWLVILVVSVLLVLLWVFISDFFADNSFFQNRIEETMAGDSSGRDTLYSSLIHHYLHDASIFQMLFGMGAEGTIKVTYNYAHNDWLEILTNQGLFGICCFSYYWLAFYRTYKSKKYTEEARFALKYIFIIMFLRTFFSMSIGEMNIYSSSMLGYALYDGFRRDFGTQGA